jgi:peptide deformylase
MKFVQPSDPILIKTADAIPLDSLTSNETRAIIEEMLNIAYGKRDRKKAVLVGLAAPQVGISKRIVLVDVLADGKGTTGDLRVYINPEIVYQSENEEEWYDGCWSTDRVTGIVSRSVSIRIKAYSQTGELVEEEHNGYTARIFQHEIDHLNGKEFVTHINDPRKLHWVESDQWVEYREGQAWRNWPYKCEWDRWKEIKGIK